MVKMGSYVGYYGHQLQYLKKTKKLYVTTKCSVWTKYKTKRFPLSLNSIAPSLDGVHEKKSPKLIMTYVGSCDGKSGELCWIFWSSIAVLKEKYIYNVNTKCSVWAYYKTKGFSLSLNSITPTLDDGHVKNSHTLLMTYVGSWDGKSEELCWLFWSSVAVLKEKQIKCHHQNI